MISALRRGASSMARADFPDPVGPVRIRAFANGEVTAVGLTNHHKGTKDTKSRQELDRIDQIYRI